MEDEPDLLKKLFENHHIEVFKSSSLDANYWRDALSILQKKNLPTKEIKLIDLKKLALLHERAINILKTLLPESEIVFDEADYIEKKKRPLQRLFTCAKLKQIIEEKNLSHAHLPCKMIAIRAKDDSFVTPESAEKILDEIIMLTTYKSSSDISIRLSDDSKDYSLVVFAERKKNYNCSLNKKARKHLKKLVKHVPFDLVMVIFLLTKMVMLSLSILNTKESLKKLPFKN